jgi:sulfite exporter TauE/SafE
MPTDASYFAAWLVGLMGGLHCLGMCGGLVAALTFGLPEAERSRSARVAFFLLAYNLGRIASYAAAGALLGAAGYVAAHLLLLHRAERILQLTASLFMAALGLYLAGWWLGLARIEAAGGVVWRRIEPLARRLVPVRNFPQAVMLGVLWGWLPCGLVYSVLIWAMASGSAGSGALLMLSFGIGTLPTLMLTGALSSRVATLTRVPWLRGVAGLAILALAAGMLASSLR